MKSEESVVPVGAGSCERRAAQGGRRMAQHGCMAVGASAYWLMSAPEGSGEIAQLS